MLLFRALSHLRYFFPILLLHIYYRSTQNVIKKKSVFSSATVLHGAMSMRIFPQLWRHNHEVIVMHAKNIFFFYIKYSRKCICTKVCNNSSMYQYLLSKKEVLGSLIKKGKSEIFNIFKFEQSIPFEFFSLIQGLYVKYGILQSKKKIQKFCFLLILAPHLVFQNKLQVYPLSFLFN